MSIEEDASAVLNFLNSKGDNEYCEAKRISDKTGLTPDEINDAVEILESNGYVESLKFLGTAPYRFGKVAITSHGRFALEKVKQPQSEYSNMQTGFKPPVNPVGSPFGFNDEDWEYITEERENHKNLKVVLGYQFDSKYYSSAGLCRNIKRKFTFAVSGYNGDPKSINISLEFIKLGAGFGEHVFNEIARDIISADIAVFDTSDLNPNVMLEMGVALTWGVRVLPIRSDDCPSPPSDISGQTWATYEPLSDASKFKEAKFQEKLKRMVFRAAQKKAR